MSNPAEIFKFPYNAFLKHRMEFVILRDDDFQSRIMRIIEYKMVAMKDAWLEEVSKAVENNLPIPPEPDYWVTLSYAQIAVQLYMFNSSIKPSKDGEDDRSVVEGKNNSVSRNTIGKAMNALITDEYVLTRPNPDKSKEFYATQYKLNVPLIQGHLNLLPADSKAPIIYFATNGRIGGVPCTKFLHPIAQDPCTKFGYGSEEQDAQNLDMGCKNFGSRDAQNSDILIEDVIELGKNTNRSSITSSHGSDGTQPSLSAMLAQFQAQLAEVQSSLEAANKRNEELQAQVTILSQQRQPESSLERTEASMELSTSGQGVDKSAVDVQGENANHIAPTTTNTTQPELLPANVTPLFREVQKQTGDTSKPAETETPKRTRKGTPINDRVKVFYDTFEALAREFFDNPEYIADRPFSKTSPTYQTAKSIVSEEVPTEDMRAVFQSMWDDVSWDGKGTHYWQDAERFDTAAYCRHYNKRLNGIKTKQHKAKNTSQNQHPTGRLVAATPGSQYIVDELVSRADDNLKAWLATPEGQAAMAEAEQLEAQQLAAVGGR